MPSEEAKAAKETAKAVGKSVDAARELGRFFGQFLVGPLTQASGILDDRLKYVRWERQMRLMARAKIFLSEQGMDAPTQDIPLNVGLPLIEAASIEEDDEVQDIWARLLVNAGDVNSGIDVTPSIVSIVKDLRPIDAKVLNAIYDAPKDLYTNGAVITEGLPDNYVPPEDNRELQPPPESVHIALWNLKRLGCITEAGTWDSLTNVLRVRITELGEAVVRACTLTHGK